ncbi:MAG: FtsX-like permease family protein [Elusimicrobiota bacterium]
MNHRPGAFGWAIGWLATGSVAVGVMALIITLSVMTGFREDIRSRILGIQPHIILTPFTGTLPDHPSQISNLLEQNGNILAFSPFVSGQILIGKGASSSGAILKGINPALEPRVANLEGKLLGAQWNDLTIKNDRPDFPKNKIFLGTELAKNIGARVGDKVWVVTPGSVGLTPFSIPKAHVFEFSGVVQSGLYDYDSALAYMDLEPSQRVLDMKSGISGFGMRIKNPDQVETIVRKLQLDLDGTYWVRSWLSLNKNLFSALKLEKTVMFIILILITVVAAVMVVTNLLLSISQKIKEIGILCAMGATSKTIHNIFLLQGLFMGTLGTMIGAVFGVVGALVLKHSNLISLPADVYYIDKLPVKIIWGDIFLVVTVAILIVLIATIYPARRASKIDPIEAIRFG